MSLINCKFELKRKRSKYCVLCAACPDNTATNPNNIIFTIKDTKLYVPVVTLLTKHNQSLSKFLRKGYERSVYWNEQKTKSKNKNTTNKYRYFLESNFVGVNRLFVLAYSNQDEDAKRFRTPRYYLPKGIIDNYNVVINGKNFYDQPIDSGVKRLEEIRKLATRQGKDCKDCTTRCLFDYDYIKNHYEIINNDLSRQKNRYWLKSISTNRICRKNKKSKQ